MAKVIALMGNKGAGKDTVAKFIKKNAKGYNHVYIMSFADALKDATAIIFNLDRKMLEGTTPESRTWREKELPYLSKVMHKKVTPRYLLQQLGTNILRRYLYDGIWIDSVVNKILALVNDDRNSLFIVTDCRFKNEIKALKNIPNRDFNFTKTQFVEIDRRSRGSDTYQNAYIFNTTKNPIKKYRAWLKIRKIHRSEWDWIGVVKDPILVYNIGTLKNLENLTKTIIL